MKGLQGLAILCFVCSIALIACRDTTGPPEDTLPQDQTEVILTQDANCDTPIVITNMPGVAPEQVSERPEYGIDCLYALPATLEQTYNQEEIEIAYIDIPPTTLNSFRYKQDNRAHPYSTEYG